MSAPPPRIEFYSAHAGERLAARIWSAPKLPIARAVFVHGITSHGGWYEQSAAYLAAAGFDVAFLDRRGSGLNGENMGDIDDWHTWVDDVAAFVKDQARATDAGSSRGAPTFLCGISWGGKLAAAVAREYPGLFAGVALICPGIYSPYMPGLLKKLALAAPLGERVRQRRLRIPLRDPKLFTNTPSWQQFIGRDPLSLRTITWRFAQEDRRLTRYAREAAWFVHQPSLVMLAGQDRIVDNSKVREFFGRMPSRQKTLIEYGDAAHTLEFEPDPTPYFRDLGGWIERTAAAIG